MTDTDKTMRNKRVQARYDELMREGKHGHYETMFRVVREEVEAAIRACASGCQKATVAACPACEGHGVTTVVITGPDGPMQDLDRCEYCGRPCDAIRERFGAET